MYSGVIISTVFWLFIAAVAITPMIIAYKTRRAAMDNIRAAIEKGQELSPEVIKQLSKMAEMPDKQEMPGNRKAVSLNLKIAGVIVMASGIGTAVVATVFAFTLPVAAPYIYAGAGLVICIGAGLYYAAVLMHQHALEQEQASNQSV
jgi:hypothetical protein